MNDSLGFSDTTGLKSQFVSLTRVEIREWIELLNATHHMARFQRVSHQCNQMLLQAREHQDAVEHVNRELSHKLAQETVVREEVDREQHRMLTTLAAQISQIERVLANVQAHAEQVQMESERKGEETEARWHRQQHEALEQLRAQMTADMQRSVEILSQQWHHRLTDLHVHCTSLHDHLVDEQQRRVHAEAHLLRLRRQRRIARRQQ